MFSLYTVFSHCTLQCPPIRPSSLRRRKRLPAIPAVDFASQKLAQLCVAWFLWRRKREWKAHGQFQTRRGSCLCRYRWTWRKKKIRCAVAVADRDKRRIARKLNRRRCSCGKYSLLSIGPLGDVGESSSSWLQAEKWVGCLVEAF